jgi:hypothetical protein
MARLAADGFGGRVRVGLCKEDYFAATPDKRFSMVTQRQLQLDFRETVAAVAAKKRGHTVGY